MVLILFLFKRDYPDGLVNKTGFGKIFLDLFPQGKPEKYAKFAFKAFDTDNNGKISFSEFLISSALSDITKESYDQEKTYEFAFDLYDDDNDGRVNFKEALVLVNAVYELKSGFTDEEADKKVQEIFEKYDADNNGYLDKKEFITALRSDENIREIFLV